MYRRPGGHLEGVKGASSNAVSHCSKIHLETARKVSVTVLGTVPNNWVALASLGGGRLQHLPIVQVGKPRIPVGQASPLPGIK